MSTAPYEVRDHRFVGKREWGMNAPFDAPCQRPVEPFPGHGGIGICSKPHYLHKTECPSGLMIAGANYPCEMGAPHDGWAHANQAAQAIWGDGKTRATPEQHRMAGGGGNVPIPVSVNVDPGLGLREFLRWMVQEGIGNVPYPNATVDAYLREKNKSATENEGN